MGQINVEGLGVIEIKGDTPDEEETRVILNSVRDLDQKEESPAPIPEPRLGKEFAPEGPVKGPY